MAEGGHHALGGQGQGLDHGAQRAVPSASPEDIPQEAFLNNDQHFQFTTSSASQMPLKKIFAYPGEVHSRDFLLTRFWGVDFDGGDATLIVAIHRLREKLWSDAHLVETMSCV